MKLKMNEKLLNNITSTLDDGGRHGDNFRIYGEYGIDMFISIYAQHNDDFKIETMHSLLVNNVGNILLATHNDFELRLNLCSLTSKEFTDEEVKKFLTDTLMTETDYHQSF